MAARVGEVGRGDLMGPRLRDAAGGERAHYAGVGPCRPRTGARPTRRQVGDVPKRSFVGIGALDRAVEQFATEHRPNVTTASAVLSSTRQPAGALAERVQTLIEGCCPRFEW